MGLRRCWPLLLLLGCKDPEAVKQSIFEEVRARVQGRAPALQESAPPRVERVERRLQSHDHCSEHSGMAMERSWASVAAAKSGKDLVGIEAKEWADCLEILSRGSLLLPSMVVLEQSHADYTIAIENYIKVLERGRQEPTLSRETTEELQRWFKGFASAREARDKAIEQARYWAEGERLQDLAQTGPALAHRALASVHAARGLVHCLSRQTSCEQEFSELDAARQQWDQASREATGVFWLEVYRDELTEFHAQVANFRKDPPNRRELAELTARIAVLQRNQENLVIP